MNRSRGFTLLELLVAIVVFGTMSAIAYRGLIAVAITDDDLQRESADLARLQFAVGLIERDLRQAMPRGIRDAFGQPVAALVGTPFSIQLTRTGWSNPTARPRANLERVDYQFNANELVRAGWPVLDRTQGSTARLDVLLEEIEVMRWAYLDEQLEWQADWPPQARPGDPSTEAWPVAVSISFQSPRFGTVERVFALVESPRPSNQASASPEGLATDG